MPSSSSTLLAIPAAATGVDAVAVMGAAAMCGTTACTVCSFASVTAKVDQEGYTEEQDDSEDADDAVKCTGGDASWGG